MPLLELCDIKVHFPLPRNKRTQGQGLIRAVDGISLRIEQGQTLGLVGESGCGKSTLCKAIMQLQKIDSGKIILQGQELQKLSSKELRAKRLDFQMIFQDPYASLNPRFTIYSTLLEALRCNKKHPIPKGQEEEAVAELLEQVGLGREQMYKYPHQFSGGQRQRIAIARALAPKPSLIIADEPVSALDVSIQSQILNLLTELQQKLGLTLLFISHDLAVVRYMSDSIAVMQAGKIVEYAAAEEIFAHPQHPYTQQLLRACSMHSPHKPHS